MRRFRDHLSRLNIRQELNYKPVVDPYDCWDHPEDLDLADHWSDLRDNLAVPYGHVALGARVGVDERCRVRRPKGWWRRIEAAMDAGHDELEADLALPEGF